jgi:hypothetical protein
MSVLTFLPPQLLALYQNPFFIAIIMIPAILIILDLVSGVGAALTSGKFDTRKLMDVLTSSVLPYVLAHIVVLAAYSVSGSVIATAAASALLMTGLTATMVASIYSNFREFTPAAMMQEVDAVGALVGMPDLTVHTTVAIPQGGPSASSSPSVFVPSQLTNATQGMAPWEASHAVQATELPMPQVSSSSSVE